ncbi:hypothetical protein L0222_07730 [bacterium]|nr:hypothetical protein [bacterium]
MPGYGMIKQEAPKFLWKLIPIKPPRVETLRRGTPFWVQAGNHGVRTTVLTVPLSFPPDEIHGGYMLAGLPLPDIRGNLGRYSYWATDLSDFESGDTEFGGNLTRLEFNGDTATASIVGPISPILKAEQEEVRKIPKDQRTIEQQARLEELSEPAYKDLKIEMQVQRKSNGVRIEFAGDSFELKKGQWSEWQDLTFKITPIVRVHGIAQFLLLENQPEIKLFMSPINWDPRNPPLPITKPDNWSKKLVQEVGMFRTLGWAEETMPLVEGRIDEATFIHVDGNEQIPISLLQFILHDFDPVVHSNVCIVAVQNKPGIEVHSSSKRVKAVVRHNHQSRMVVGKLHRLCDYRVAANIRIANRISVLGRQLRVVKRVFRINQTEEHVLETVRSFACIFTEWKTRTTHWPTCLIREISGSTRTGAKPKCTLLVWDRSLSTCQDVKSLELFSPEKNTEICKTNWLRS